MSRFEQDTIMRQIRQLGDAIAAIAARMRGDGDYESGLEAIRTAAAGGLGVERGLLERFDAPAAVMLLHDPARALAYAQVCAAEAEALAGLGRPAEAARLRERAAQIEAVASTLRHAG